MEATEVEEVKTLVPFHRMDSPGSLALISVSVERMSMLLHNFFSAIYARLFFFFCFCFFFFWRSPLPSSSSTLTALSKHPRFSSFCWSLIADDYVVLRLHRYFCLFLVISLLFVSSYDGFDYCIIICKGTAKYLFTKSNRCSNNQRGWYIHLLIVISNRYLSIRIKHVYLA